MFSHHRTVGERFVALHVTQPRRDRPPQPAVAKTEMFEKGQSPQPRRNRPCEPVATHEEGYRRNVRSCKAAGICPVNRLPHRFRVWRLLRSQATPGSAPTARSTRSPEPEDCSDSEGRAGWVRSSRRPANAGSGVWSVVPAKPEAARRLGRPQRRDHRGRRDSPRSSVSTFTEI